VHLCHEVGVTIPSRPSRSYYNGPWISGKASRLKAWS